jgi:hypothetical protein
MIASRNLFLRSSCETLVFIQPELLSTKIDADTNIDRICLKPIVAFLHQLPIESGCDTVQNNTN